MSSLTRERRAFERMLGNQPLAHGVRAEAAAVDGVGGVQLTPPRVLDGRTLLFLHGGGYVMGSPRTHQALASHIAREIDARALVMDYRLAPEHPYPAALEDTVTVYNALLTQTRPETLALAGSSAGAGLALACLLHARDTGQPMPSAAALMSPWTDLRLTGRSIDERAARDPILSREKLTRYRDHYLAGTDPASPFVSPLNGDLRGLPPLLIQVGTEEVLYDDANRLNAAAQAAGVQATFEAERGATHAFQSNTTGDKARGAIQRIARFLDAHLRGRASVAGPPGLDLSEQPQPPRQL
jgi:acetyl esterase/lipase